MLETNLASITCVCVFTCKENYGGRRDEKWAILSNKNN